MKKSTKTIKLIFSLVMIALIGLSSCKKNDASPNINQQFLGKWKYMSSSTKEYENNVLIDSEDSTPQFNIYMTLRADGTCTIENDDPNNPGGNTNYTISDNKLTFRASNGTSSDPWDIVEVTDTQLTLGYTVISGTYRVEQRDLFDKVE